MVAARVLKARDIQSERYEGYNIRLNNNLDGQLIIDYAIPIDEGRAILNEAAKKFRLSMRAYNRVLRVSRTIADLAGSQSVRKMHVAEALSYRQMDFTSREAA
jgi:magnesium chelatase family protein